MLGSVAVVSAAVVIALTEWLRADVSASVAVALMVLPRIWTLLREAIDVLLEATPRNVDILSVRKHILDSPGVRPRTGGRSGRRTRWIGCRVGAAVSTRRSAHLREGP